MGLMDLFRPSWKHSSWKVRRDAVSQLTNQKVLAQIARADRNQDVRMAALNELADRNELAKIAKAELDSRVGLYAVSRLKRQSHIAEVAQSAKNEKVRVAAVAMLIDQRLLANIATTDDSCDMRMTAVRKLTAQPILAEIAKNERESMVRIVAVQQLADHARLIEIAKEDSDTTVRMAAAMKLVREGVAVYGGGTDASQSLLAWLLSHRGRRVHWKCGNDLGEWTISTPEIEREGEYVFSVPYTYFLTVLQRGMEFKEERTRLNCLTLPSAVAGTFHVDGGKAHYALYRAKFRDVWLAGEDNEMESIYQEEWSFALVGEEATTPP